MGQNRDHYCVVIIVAESSIDQEGFIVSALKFMIAMTIMKIFFSPKDYSSAWKYLCWVFFGTQCWASVHLVRGCP